jgi:hypothetical protein
VAALETQKIRPDEIAERLMIEGVLLDLADERHVADDGSQRALVSHRPDRGTSQLLRHRLPDCLDVRSIHHVVAVPVVQGIDRPVAGICEARVAGRKCGL